MLNLKFDASHHTKIIVSENPGDLAGLEAHCGMLKAARYVFAELREKNILNKAFSYFDGYTVRMPIRYENC